MYTTPHTITYSSPVLNMTVNFGVDPFKIVSHRISVHNIPLIGHWYPYLSNENFKSQMKIIEDNNNCSILVRDLCGRNVYTTLHLYNYRILIRPTIRIRIQNIFLPSFLRKDGAQCHARIALLAPTKLRELRNTRVLLEYPWWLHADLRVNCVIRANHANGL